MLIQKINRPVYFIFTNSPEIRIFADRYCIPNAISIEILKYMPEYVRCMRVHDLHLSSKLQEIARVRLDKNKNVIIIKKCDIFKNYSDVVVKIVLDYIALYPKFTIETEKISRNFKNRNLDTLLIRDEFDLLNLHLKKTNNKYNVKFIASIMRLALSLDLSILAEKCGAIIAMFIKDKPLEFIEDIFTKNKKE